MKKFQVLLGGQVPVYYFGWEDSEWIFALTKIAHKDPATSQIVQIVNPSKGC